MEYFDSVGNGCIKNKIKTKNPKNRSLWYLSRFIDIVGCGGRFEPTTFGYEPYTMKLNFHYIYS